MTALGASRIVRGLLSLSGLAFALAGAACSAPAAPSARTPPIVRAPDEAPALATAPLPTEPPARFDDRYAVACESVVAVEIARTVLERKGTAIDAAVAGLLAAGYAHPSSGGLGGGGFALHFDAASKQVVVVDFRETAPGGLRRLDHLSRSPKPDKRGVSVGVPGLVAGLAALHERGGKLPIGELYELVAQLAERGAPTSPYAARALAWSAGWRATDPRAAALGPLDASPRRGVVVPNPALASTLRAIAAGGPSAFYTGPVADDLVTTARAAGSRVVLADLRDYRAFVREPLRARWNGHEVLVPPLPSGGGLAVLLVLGAIAHDEVPGLGLDTASGLHVVAELLRGAHQDRVTFAGDPRYTKLDPAIVLDPARLRARRAQIRDDATNLPKLPSIADGGTLHLSVVDEAGSAVSATITLGSSFGSKLVTAGGYALNDALVDFTTDEYGQKPTSRGPNFPRGGARPASSLTPTMVLRDGALVAALGGSGGLRAPTGVAQVLLAHLGLDEPLPSAVARPRLHVTYAGALQLDPALAPLELELVARGEVVESKEPQMGAVTGIAVRQDRGVRVFEPAFDHRKGGAVTVARRPSAPR